MACIFNHQIVVCFLIADLNLLPIHVVSLVPHQDPWGNERSQEADNRAAAGEEGAQDQGGHLWWRQRQHLPSLEPLESSQALQGGGQREAAANDGDRCRPQGHERCSRWRRYGHLYIIFFIRIDCIVEKGAFLPLCDNFWLYSPMRFWTCEWTPTGFAFIHTRWIMYHNKA